MQLNLIINLIIQTCDHSTPEYPSYSVILAKQQKFQHFLKSEVWLQQLMILKTRWQRCFDLKTQPLFYGNHAWFKEKTLFHELLEEFTLSWNTSATVTLTAWRGYFYFYEATGKMKCSALLQLLEKELHKQKYENQCQNPL